MKGGDLRCVFVVGLLAGVVMDVVIAAVLAVGVLSVVGCVLVIGCD